MEAKQVGEVLIGFSTAVSVVADEFEPSERYQLRVRDVKKQSFHFLMEIIAFARENPEATKALAELGGVALAAIKMGSKGAWRVLQAIARLIEAKKKLKGAKLAKLKTTFKDGEVIIELEGDLLRLTKGEYELLLGRYLDRAIAQVVSPLDPNRIDTFGIVQADKILTQVQASEKPYFETTEESQQEVKETLLKGKLNSLSKSKFRGTLHTTDGTHVQYRYVGKDMNALYEGFASKDDLKIHGRVRYASDGIPIFVEVDQIEVLQQRMFEQPRRTQKDQQSLQN